jgi:hypothetical protein
MHTNPFATEAAQYAHLRPTYPESVFAFLSKTVASGDVAWDCATGKGQAATHLARYFGRVVATDESAEMIGQAPRLGCAWGQRRSDRYQHHRWVPAQPKIHPALQARALSTGHFQVGDDFAGHNLCLVPLG